MDSVRKVRKFYDEVVQKEWERFDRHPVEFALNQRFIGRYIKPGDKVLDLGGGPGRYSLWLAEKGCDVILADLSPNNVAFAQEKAHERGVRIKGATVDARDLSQFNDSSFDHVLCMGPMYHLTEENDRRTVINECLRVLKPGGTLSSAFISSYAEVLYCLKFDQTAILRPEKYDSVFKVYIENTDFSGTSFTEIYYARHDDILPFFSSFQLDPIHFLGSESIFSPYEPSLMNQSPEVFDAWIDFAEKVCEREDLLSFSEHFLYIGRKSI